MEEYLVFEPAVKPLYRENHEDFWFLFKENKLMIIKEGEEINIPRRKDIEKSNSSIQYTQYIGAYYDYNCHCGEITDNINRGNIDFIDLRSLPTFVNEDMYSLASRANLLLNWIKLNQHCGICGSKMYQKDSQFERAMVCSNCGNTTWPRTSPAIIVAITKGDKLLLAHNRNFPEGRYSVIAGFVEYAETFEECVKREVYEEVGIKIKNIKYFGSQPWPYPNSMMVAFTAEYLEGDIREDGDEIVHADWYSKEEVEGMYSKSISISSKLIEWFINNR